MFLVPWPLVCLIFLLTGNLSAGVTLLWIVLVPELFCLLGWFLLSSLHTKISSSPIVIIAISGFLALSDQIIKILFNTFFGWEKSVPIIRNAFSFKITPNYHGSYIASLLDVEVPAVIYLIFYPIAGFIVFLIFQHYSRKNGNTGWLNLARVFFLAAIAAAACDRIFWGYTLDYAAVKNMFVFDIKDLFANLSVLTLLAEMVKARVYR